MTVLRASFVDSSGRSTLCLLQDTLDLVHHAGLGLGRRGGVGRGRGVGAVMTEAVMLMS